MLMNGFEVNTDVAFIDPDWEIFEELHNRRYGLAIGYLKSVVQGDVFDNKVMQLRVSGQGFYVQSISFPAAFYGDMAKAIPEFVSEDEARALIFEAFALYRAGDARSLTCVYSEAQPADVFFGYRVNADECYELGHKRSSLPLHLRVMVDAAEDSELLGSTCGALIYQRTLDGRHLIVRASRAVESVPHSLIAVSDIELLKGPAAAKPTLERQQALPLLHGFFE